MKGTGIFFCFFLLIYFSAFCQRNISAGTKQNVSDMDILSTAVDQYRFFLSTHIVIDSSGAAREVAMIKKASSRMIAAVTTYYTQKKQLTELKGYNWEINLVDEKEVNGWCMPGGKMVVYTGLLDFAHNEGSVAVVLAHEIAHSLLKHGNNRLKPMLQEYMGGKSFQEALKVKPADAKDIYLMAYGIGTGMGKTIGVMPAFSQKDEMEADKLALIFTALAGYNPRETLVLWQRMANFSKTARQPEFLSAHPMNDKRKEEMSNLLDEITRNYYKPLNKS